MHKDLVACKEQIMDLEKYRNKVNEVCSFGNVIAGMCTALFRNVNNLAARFSVIPT